MAQVPYQAYPSVSPSGPPTPYQSAAGASPDAFGAGVGQAIGQLGDVLSKHAIAFQDRANQATATDLYTKAVVEVGNLDAKFGTLEGKAKADAYPQYQADILAIQEKYRASAPNVDVQHQFDNDFKRRMAYSLVDAAKSSAVATKQYNNTAQKSRLALSMQDAAANAQDDQKFALALDDANKSIDAMQKENSWGPDEAKLYKDNAIASLWEARLKSMAITDPFRAKALFDQHKDEIVGVDKSGNSMQLATKKFIDEGIVKAGTRIDANTIWNQTQPDLERAARGIRTIESGSPEGNYTTVSAVSKDGDRAYGAYQVMGKNVGPWTEQYYGKRLTPQEFLQNKEAQDAVFQGEFGKYLTKYGPENAARAWFGGEGGITNPGATDVYGKLTIADYGKKFMGMFGPDVGPGTDRLSAALDQATTYADKRFPDDPGMKALYEDQLRQRLITQYNLDNRVRKEHRLALTTTVMSELIPKPDGSPPATTIEQLSQPAQQAFFDMEPDQKRRVMKQMESNAKADVPLTPERYSKFQETMGKALTNPDEFLATAPGELDLPRTLQSQIFAKQRQMQGKLQDTTKINSALRTVAPMLNDAGIYASHTDTSTNAKYNQFVGAFDAKLKEFEDQNKKFPTEEEQRKIASQLLTDQAGTGWFGTNFGATRQYEVPQSFMDEWKPKFNQRYGRDPTPGELFRLYQLSKK